MTLSLPLPLPPLPSLSLLPILVRCSSSILCVLGLLLYVDSMIGSDFIVKFCFLGGILTLSQYLKFVAAVDFVVLQ